MDHYYSLTTCQSDSGRDPNGRDGSGSIQTIRSDPLHRVLLSDICNKHHPSSVFSRAQRAAAPRRSLARSLPQSCLQISMMAHIEDVDVSVLNERVGTAECRLQRKPFVLRRPICLLNETVVQSRTARPRRKDAAAAALVLLR